MFKPQHTVDWYYMEDKTKSTPKSTTHEMLESGYLRKRNYGAVHKKILNFRTYFIKDYRFNSMNIKHCQTQPLTTTYERDYARKTLLTKPKELIPDKFWNRKPLNDFAIERITSSEFMFMDDHLVNITEERKKVNFLRQLRNQHVPLV